MLDWLGNLPGVADGVKKLLGPFLGRLTIRIEADSSSSFFIVPDVDDNRYPRDGNISYGLFNVGLFLSCPYKIIIHKVDAYVYSNGRQEWIALDDRAIPPAGQELQKQLRSFTSRHPPFTRVEIDQSSAHVEIAKIGHLLDAGLAHGNRHWRGYYYTELLIVFNINTSFVLVTCVIPEWNGISLGAARIVHDATIYREDDRAKFFQIASGNMGSLDQPSMTSTRTALWVKVK